MTNFHCTNFQKFQKSSISLMLSQQRPTHQCNDGRLSLIKYFITATNPLLSKMYMIFLSNFPLVTKTIFMSIILFQLYSQLIAISRSQAELKSFHKLKLKDVWENFGDFGNIRSRFMCATFEADSSNGLPIYQRSAHFDQILH